MEQGVRQPRRSFRTIWNDEPSFRWATIIIASLSLFGPLVPLFLLDGSSKEEVVVAATMVEEAPQTYYTGRVGEQHIHRIALWLEEEDGRLHGLYWYLQWAPNAEKFEVTGYRVGDRVVLRARLSDWESHEVFRGRIHADGTIEGCWFSHDGCKRLLFRVRPSKEDMLELPVNV